MAGSDTTADRAEVDGDLGLLVLDERGRRFVPLRARLVIGRAADCDVVLTDPLVSRRHVQVFATSPPTVVDAGSKLGTRLDGRRLGPGERAALGEGAALWVGATCITLGRAAGATAGAAPPIDPGAGYVIESPRLRALFEIATLSARSPLAVFIHGESGSGKELVAECIHRASGRPGRLVRLNCAAVAESMPEAELFGYERGAFTGATAAKPGLLETAHLGTLFLDEVADLSLGLQAKLLRVLETGEFLRLGSVAPRRVDARVVSASHKALADEVRRGRFREDLLYRLAGIQLEVPPLRERPEDIVPLARRFLREHRVGGHQVPTLAADAERWLLAQPWPGNVRELRAAVMRAALFSRGSHELAASHFALGDSGPGPTVVATVVDERARIAQALVDAGHNQTRAAERLGMSRRTLLRRLEALGFTRPRKGPPA